MGLMAIFNFRPKNNQILIFLILINNEIHLINFEIFNFIRQIISQALIVTNIITRLPGSHFLLKCFFRCIRGKVFILTYFFLTAASLSAQTVVNVATGTLEFLQANRVSIIGNGTVVGDKILYTNVITLNGQQIDCIVTTVSLTNATFTLPTGSAAGTTPHDYSSTTGNGLSSNSDAYFSPTFNMGTGGGSVRFRFQFILGGSYNATTNPTGTPILLENLRLNTYDLDGNGTSGTNQYAEFGGFSSYTLGNPTNLTQSYNATSGLTKFRSNISSNVTNVTDSRQRATVDFASISEFEMLLGSDGGGVSYFFLDFSAGVTWSPTTTTTTTYTPLLDLNTSTSGINNSVSDCYAVQSMTYGGTNLTNVSSGFVNEIIIDFLSTDIQDGAAEEMFIAGATGTNQLALNFTTSGSQSFSLGGITYSLARSVSSGVSTMRITRSTAGGWTTGEAEALLDSIRYAHTATPKTSGNRTFGVIVREGSLLTPKANFIIQIPCTILTLKWVHFDVKKIQRNKVSLLWKVQEIAGSEGFEIEVSLNGVNWIKKAYLSSSKSFNSENTYTLLLVQNTAAQTFYRIKNLSSTGNVSFSSNKLLTADPIVDFQVWPNPFNESFLFVNPTPYSLNVRVVDQFGRIVAQCEIAQKTTSIPTDSWPVGVYTVFYTMPDGKVDAIKVIKR